MTSLELDNINSLKYEFLLNDTRKFISHVTGNRLHLGQEDPPVNPAHYCESHSKHTHIHSVNRMHSFGALKQVVHREPMGSKRLDGSWEKVKWIANGQGKVQWRAQAQRLYCQITLLAHLVCKKLLLFTRFGTLDDMTCFDSLRPHIHLDLP